MYRHPRPLLYLVESLVYPPACTEGLEEYLEHISISISHFMQANSYRAAVRTLQDLRRNSLISESVEEIAEHLASSIKTFLYSDSEV